jgi:hypothetical protein
MTYSGLLYQILRTWLKGLHPLDGGNGDLVGRGGPIAILIRSNCDGIIDAVCDQTIGGGGISAPQS